MNNAMNPHKFDGAHCAHCGVVRLLAATRKCCAPTNAQLADIFSQLAGEADGPEARELARASGLIQAQTVVVSTMSAAVMDRLLGKSAGRTARQMIAALSR